MEEKEKRIYGELDFKHFLYIVESNTLVDVPPLNSYFTWHEYGLKKGKMDQAVINDKWINTKNFPTKCFHRRNSEINPFFYSMKLRIRDQGLSESLIVGLKIRSCSKTLKEFRKRITHQAFTIGERTSDTTSNHGAVNILVMLMRKSQRRESNKLKKIKIGVMKPKQKPKQKLEGIQKISTRIRLSCYD